MNIYVSRDGQNYGPYPAEQAHAMVQQGQLALGDLACPEGAQQWVPLGQILGIPPNAGAPVAPTAGAPLAHAAQAVPIAQPASSIHPHPQAYAAAPTQGSYSAHFAIQQAYNFARSAYAALGLAAALTVLGLGLPALTWAAGQAAPNAIIDFFGQTLGMTWGLIIGLSLAAIGAIWFVTQNKKAQAAKYKFDALRHAGL